MSEDEKKKKKESTHTLNTNNLYMMPQYLSNYFKIYICIDLDLSNTLISCNYVKNKNINLKINPKNHI